MKILIKGSYYKMDKAQKMRFNECMRRKTYYEDQLKKLDRRMEGISRDMNKLFHEPARSVTKMNKGYLNFDDEMKKYPEFEITKADEGESTFHKHYQEENDNKVIDTDISASYSKNIVKSDTYIGTETNKSFVKTVSVKETKSKNK